MAKKKSAKKKSTGSRSNSKPAKRSTSSRPTTSKAKKSPSRSNTSKKAKSKNVKHSKKKSRPSFRSSRLSSQKASSKKFSKSSAQKSKKHKTIRFEGHIISGALADIIHHVARQNRMSVKEYLKKHAAEVRALIANGFTKLIKKVDTVISILNKMRKLKVTINNGHSKKKFPRLKQ